MKRQRGKTFWYHYIVHYLLAVVALCKCLLCIYSGLRAWSGRPSCTEHPDRLSHSWAGAYRPRSSIRAGSNPTHTGDCSVPTDSWRHWWHGHCRGWRHLPPVIFFIAAQYNAVYTITTVRSENAYGTAVILQTAVGKDCLLLYTFLWGHSTPCLKKN